MSRQPRFAKFALAAAVALSLFATVRADRTVSENWDLDADYIGDSAQGVLTVNEGVTINLNGHKLEVSGLSGAGTITDSTSGGELHVVVESGESLQFNTVVFAGNLKLVKEGDGELVLDKPGQTYTGGTDINGGSLKLPAGRYPGHNGGHFFGANPQTVTVNSGGTLDVNNGYDYHANVNIVLAGGTIANYGANSDNAGWGGSAAHSLTADSVCNAPFSYVWQGSCNLASHTLTVNISGSRNFWIGGNSAFTGDGKVVVQNADSDSNYHYFKVVGECDSRTVDFEINNCRIENQNYFRVHDFIFNGEAAYVSWDHLEFRTFVYGTFEPKNDKFPNVELQDGARLNLTGRTDTATWSTKSSGAAAQYYCTFADNAKITIDITGRGFATGDQVIAWDAMPDNVATLTFKFDTGASELVPGTITSEGVNLGADASGVAVFAVWTGDAGDGDISNPVNWNCRSGSGETIEGVLPGSGTYIDLSGGLHLNNSSFEYASVTLRDCYLTGDSDLRGLDFNATASTIDLKGKKLYISSLSGIATITDSVGGGELHVDVADGATLDNTATEFTGGLKLVKDGGGTFVATKAFQSYTCGTLAAGGTLKAGAEAGVRPFGAVGSTIAVAQGGVFDVNGKDYALGYPIESAGGEIVLSTVGAGGEPLFDDFVFNNDARPVGEKEISLTRAENWSYGQAFWKRRVNPSVPWRAAFHYYIDNPNSNPADGVTFILHNDPRGLLASGQSGGEIGVRANDTDSNRHFPKDSVITPSFGIVLSVWTSGGGKGNENVGWVDNGAFRDMSKEDVVFLREGVDVVVEYDGFGTLKQTITQDQDGTEQTYERSIAVDLGARLGTSAYVGFTSGCGQANADHRVSNFTFEQMDAVEVDLTPDTETWSVNFYGEGSAASQITTYNDKPAIEVTHRVVKDGGLGWSDYTGGASVFRQRLPMRGEFEISGTYVFVDGSGIPADGVTFVFQTDGVDRCGIRGGDLGLFGDNRLPSAVGWILNIYSNPRIQFVKNCDKDHRLDFSLSGADDVKLLDREVPVDFVITCTNGILSIDLTQEAVVNDTTVKRHSFASQQLDLAAYFGSQSTAYFTVTGGTGGESATQYVYDLKYRQLQGAAEASGGNVGVGTVRASGATTLAVRAAGASVLDMMSDVNWQTNGVSHFYNTYNGIPALEVTHTVTDGGYTAGASTFAQRLPVDGPFEITGTYVLAGGSGNPADATTFVFQDNGTRLVGGNGGQVGLFGGKFPTAVGWVFNIWRGGNQTDPQRVQFVDQGAVAQTHNLETGSIDFHQQNKPVDFKISYGDGKLSVSLTQVMGEDDVRTFSAEQTVNLAERFASAPPYFTITGGTGGESALQYVYNLKYRWLGEGAAASGPAAIGELTLVDDAAVTVRADGAEGTDYELQVGEVKFDQTNAATGPSLTFAANGTGAGVFSFDTITYDDVTAKPLSVVDAGAIGGIGETATVVFPSFKGSYKVLGTSGLTTSLVEEDFTLDSPATEKGARLRVRGDGLWAAGLSGLMVIIR